MFIEKQNNFFPAELAVYIVVKNVFAMYNHKIYRYSRKQCDRPPDTSQWIHKHRNNQINVENHTEVK